MDQILKLSGSRIKRLVVSRSGTVSATAKVRLPWFVLTESGLPVEPVAEFPRDLSARGGTSERPIQFCTSRSLPA